MNLLARETYVVMDPTITALYSRGIYKLKLKQNKLFAPGRFAVDVGCWKWQEGMLAASGRRELQRSLVLEDSQGGG